ncbi:MAG: phage late control D family protein [Desulfobacterales bacterium]|nr:MAG: phage late control D family protein [Desulfobacterales bacterium]
MESIRAEVRISVDGSVIPPEAHVAVHDIEVEQDVETVGMFNLMMAGGELENEEYRWIDGDLFRPGAEVKIEIGYGVSPEPLMVGEIVSCAPEFPDNGGVVFRVQGYERLYRLGFGRKTRSFRDMKDSDIAGQIAQDWNLTPEVDDTTVTHEYVLQNNQTDREFLTERARRNRFEVRVEDKTLYFQKPKEDAGQTVTLTYRENLVDFFPVLSTARQISKVQVRGWSPKDKAEVLGEAGSGDVVATMGGEDTGAQIVDQIAGEAVRAMCGENVATPEAAEDMARAFLNQSALAFITGEGSCIGSPQLRAGSVVELKGLGARFSGLYYVVSCRHRFGTRGYSTFFTVRRSAA